MSKEVLAYNLVCYLKSGVRVTAMISKAWVESILNEHKNTGNLQAKDLESDNMVSVYKDSIDFVMFSPIYSREPGTGGEKLNDNSTVEEGQRPQAPADNSESVTESVPTIN